VEARGYTGSAVLVHGTWGNPDDWRWVHALLRGVGVDVVVPDLPSHREPGAGLTADAEEVRGALLRCTPPIVVVGWSYGADVVGIAALGVPGVVRLLYVAAAPREADVGRRDTSWLRENPNITVSEEGTFVLDDRWWLEQEAGTTFPVEVREHLRRHPRRPASLRSETEMQTTEAAWVSTPTTVLLGSQDPIVPEEEQRRAAELVPDLRLLDCDHFIIWRDPSVVSGVVLEALNVPRTQPGGIP
jgi:pimeloyl-ACP methyl ester carboxylesterase